ncbi:MAG TPA: DUF192 domain-containing protein [Mesorhizobium sp.]|nr:DUF192 domain-containing protein [Mesorhizobium sp.]
MTRLALGLAIVAGLAVLDFVRAPALAEQTPMMLPVDSNPLVIETDGGERSFEVEIADEPAERSSGLMHRESLPDGRGMLFVLDGYREAGFWMKNTPLPLDLLFIGQDGRVKAILQGEPFSEAIITPGVPARFVLEFKAGTAAEAGIEEGDLLRHPAITAAGIAGSEG